MKERVQQWGGFLASMVVPNIGAFIAWGLITALFIATGWLPNERFAQLVSPMISYLLPILIGYTGGKIVYGHRGGVIGAVATMGVIVGTGIPQFLGGMIMGPLSAWILKKIDEVLQPRIPIGFELLINNFSLGITGVILTLLGMIAMGPAVEAASNALGAGVQALVNARLLPLADLIVEPAKVLFLNNALNLGVLAPLGAAAAAEKGRAIHFLLETNPGPGLGMLLAYWAVGKGMLKDTAPGAAIIHFLGGIHEIYFPYVLAHPIMILAMYAGGIVADTWFVLFDAGLVATPSPGSIFAYLAVIPRGFHFQVLGGVFLGAVASFLVGSLILRRFPVKEEEEEAEEEEMASIPGLA
ncbi:MAG TPA: PTS mannitol transporter subunit IICB [Chloroflexi bacterium]|jgi:PTS system mannitol-specific IIC component|nr:PTS mannitol transporter subunit IICB [Chloroflexota bacterium]